jgi:hypothetical protein
MSNQTHSGRFVRRARVIAILLIGIFLIPVLRAQPVAPAIENRYLLVFDTSAAMKKCLPAVQSSLNRLFGLSTNGPWQAGDSIGVWTFAADLRTGQFPLQSWRPETAATIASNVTAFVAKQHYAKSTRFDAVMPQLNRVVQNSGRLTVLIFCDGNGEVHGLPYDAAINAVFKQNKRAWQKARQPFILVLRTQSGVPVGLTVNSSPPPMHFPEFPPLPRPPAPSPAPPPLTNQPAPRPPIEAPPLVIIGTKVGTNLPPPAPPKRPPAATNLPPPLLPKPPPAVTSPPPPAPTNPPPAIESNPPAPAARGNRA